MAGEWVWTDKYSTYPPSCGSHLSLKYYSNGAYELPGEVGTWRLEGKVLTEATAEFLEVHDEATADEIGKQYVSTVQWIDPNRYLKRYADGDVMEFRRCLFWG